jgi:hypothetical protein
MGLYGPSRTISVPEPQRIESPEPVFDPHEEPVEPERVPERQPEREPEKVPA